MLRFIQKNYMAGKPGHYHESSDCFAYPPKFSVLKSSHLNKYLPNFPTPKYPGIKNFELKIILWSFKIWSAHPGGKEVEKEEKEKEREEREWGREVDNEREGKGEG